MVAVADLTASSPPRETTPQREMAEIELRQQLIKAIDVSNLSRLQSALKDLCAFPGFVKEAARLLLAPEAEAYARGKTPPTDSDEDGGEEEEDSEEGEDSPPEDEGGDEEDDEGPNDQTADFAAMLAPPIRLAPLQGSQADHYSPINTVRLPPLRELQNVPAGAIAPERGTKRMRARYVTCEQCKEEFDVTSNYKGDCVWHEGELEADRDSDVWDDWDERCHGNIDAMEEEYPEGFVWTCCDKDGTEEGCRRTAHKEENKNVKKSRYGY